jgi:hypothetical protein
MCVSTGSNSVSTNAQKKLFTVTFCPVVAFIVVFFKLA